MNQEINIPALVLEGGPLRPKSIISATEEELMTGTSRTVGHFQSGDHKILYSGSERKRNGVAILCGRRMAASILGFNSVSDRIICAIPGESNTYVSYPSIRTNSRVRRNST